MKLVMSPCISSLRIKNNYAGHRLLRHHKMPKLMSSSAKALILLDVRGQKLSIMGSRPSNRRRSRGNLWIPFWNSQRWSTRTLRNSSPKKIQLPVHSHSKWLKLLFKTHRFGLQWNCFGMQRRESGSWIYRSEGGCWPRGHGDKCRWNPSPLPRSARKASAPLG